MGFVYDLRGDGKSAVKVAANKYLLGQTLNGFGIVAESRQRAGRRTRSAAWADIEPRLRRQLRPGEPGRRRTSPRASVDNCGAVNNNAFGIDRPAGRRSIRIC